MLQREYVLVIWSHLRNRSKTISSWDFLKMSAMEQHLNFKSIEHHAPGFPLQDDGVQP